MDPIALPIELNDSDQLCRVCLQKVELSVKIADVAEMIEYCTNDKVHPSEQLFLIPNQFDSLYSDDSGQCFHAKSNVPGMLSSVGDFLPFQAAME